jgi:hypothetical protein
MASLFLDWREAQNGDLPMVCATCGAHATAMVERRLSTVGPGFLVIVRTKATVLLPYCPQHMVASWNGWVRVRALSISKEGIKLGQVSSDFVDAVHDYRDDPAKFERRRLNERPRDHEERPRRDDEEPLLRDDEERPRRDPGGGGLTLTVILLIVVFAVLVTVCGFGLLFFTLLRPGAVRQPAPQPGLNPQGPLAPPVVPQGPPRR